MYARSTSMSDETILALKPSGFKPSALARTMRIAPTKRTRTDANREAKRAAVVLRRGMRQTEFRRLEMSMDRNNMSTLPIVVGNKKADVPETVCGLIVTGSSAVAHPDERLCLAEIVRTAIDRQLPVLAMSDAAPLVLGVSGLDQVDDRHSAVLISGEVRLLKSRRDIDQAIDMMAASPTR